MIASASPLRTLHAELGRASSPPRGRRARDAVPVALLTWAAACSTDATLGPSQTAGGESSSSASSAGATTASSSSSGSGASSSASSSTNATTGGGGGAGPAGSGGTGGQGTGGSPGCVPGSTKSCYTGPPGTEGIGLCASGLATCDANGIGFGPCANEVLPALESCFTAADENCSGVAEPCAVPPLVTKFFAGAKSYAVGADAQGDLLVGGTFFGTTDFGAGPITSAAGAAFLVKLNPQGDLLWALTYEGAELRGLAIDGQDNVVFAGRHDVVVDLGGGPLPQPGAGTESFFLAKVDANGAHLHSQSFANAGLQNASSDEVYMGVATDPWDGIVLAGSFTGPTSFGGASLVSAGGLDLFAAKFDAAGNHVWSQRFGDAAVQRGAVVATDSAGNVLLTGNFGGTVDFGGGPLTATQADAFLVKLDADGSHVFSKRYGGGDTQLSRSVAVDSQDNVVIAGAFVGAIDFGAGPLFAQAPEGWDVFVAKMNPLGDAIWSKDFGDLDIQGATAVAVNASDDLLLCGSARPTLDFGGGPLAAWGSYDIFVVRLDAGGGHVWSMAMGNSIKNECFDVAADAVGNVLVAGRFQGGFLTKLPP